MATNSRARVVGPARLLLAAAAAVAIVVVLAVVVSGHPVLPGHGSASACGGHPVIQVDGITRHCSFDDEFSGTTLDTAKWLPVRTSAFGFQSGPACFVNSPQNIRVAGGVLDLTARRVDRPFTCRSPLHPFATQYTSGSVSTHGLFDQTYGRFAIRARFPAVRVPGLQTSLWLYPDNPQSGTRVPGRTPGEIDIAEEYSRLSTVAVPTFHYLFDRATTNPLTHTNVPTATNCAIGDLAAFHVYVLDWSPTTLRVSFDGRTCLVDHYRAEAPFAGSEPFDKPFDIELTQALGITTNAFAPGLTPLPATTQIDWVRAWK